jgi:hypothetical protein
MDPKPYKRNIPPGSGNYYAYGKVEGKTKYLGKWDEYVEQRFRETIRAATTKEKEQEHRVMVKSGHIRDLKRTGCTDSQIDHAIDDLKALYREEVISTYPELTTEIRDIYITDKNTISLRLEGLEVQQTELGEVLRCGKSQKKMDIEVPVRVLHRLVENRKGDERTENVLRKMGNEGKAIRDAFTHEAGLYDVIFHRTLPVLIGDNKAGILVESDSEALGIEEELRQKGITTKSYNTTIRPRFIVVAREEELVDYDQGLDSDNPGS